MKRTAPSQNRGNLPPRINTPNNPDFIQDYFSGHHQPSPFSPAKSIDNNMYNNNMYFPNNQMVPPNHGSPMYNTVDAIENYDLGDKKHMMRGVSTPTTPIHPMNDMNQFNVPVQFPLYGDRQQPMMPPYMGPYINNGHGNEEMMVGMGHVMKDQNNNLLSPMENTGGAQNNKKANLYKTELCRSYEETGHCRYGSKCQFAHSESELRHVDRHPKYKTEMCKTFWEQGTCPYGKRCCFIHTPRDLVKKEDVPGHTPTTPAKNMDKQMFPDANVTKKKENSTDTVNNLSEGETIALNSEEGENTVNNRSRSGSDSETATSMTEEVVSPPENEEKDKNETTIKTTEESNKEKETEEDKEKEKEKSNEKEKENEKQEVKEGEIKSENNEKEKEDKKIEKKEGNDEKEKEKESKPSENTKTSTTNDNVLTIPVITNKVQNLNKNIQANAMPIKGSKSPLEPMAKTPTTTQAFNYSTSFNGSINLNGSPLNGGFGTRRKMSSPAQRQNPRMMNNSSKGLNLNLDATNNYNNVLGINSMSYQPTSPLDNEFMLNHEMNNRSITPSGMSTSFPANDYLDDKMMFKLQNFHIQQTSTPPHTPVNGQRTPQTNQGMMSPLSSSFNQNNIFMKQPLNINTTQNNSNLFLKQVSATASPFTPGTPSSFFSPKQSHVGLPAIPLIDDESGSIKAGSLSGMGSDFGDETKSEDNSTTSSNANNNSLFGKQAINTTKAHSILKTSQKPSTPKNPSFIPSTPQSISTGFLNSGCASPLPSSRMGTSLPATPIHQNSFNPSAIDEIFSGNNSIINDYSRGSSSGINIAASPFTPSNDLSQYMAQMSSARENSGIQSLENIKSPSQMFYRSSSNSISAINTTPSAKSTGFGSMTMGGINMIKNRSESFDYGMLSPGGLNSFLGNNPVSSPIGGFNNSLASSFNNNNFLNNKMRSESVDFGQLNHFNKENNLVGSVPSISFLQSINEGIPDSPFSNHGSIQGSPLPSSTTTLNDISGGMENFMGGARRKSFQDSSLMNTRLPTVPEGRHPNMLEEDEPLFSNNNLTDEGILKFSKEHFGLDDAHSKSLLGGQGSSAMDIKGSILGGSIFSSMSPSSNSHNIF